MTFRVEMERMGEQADETHAAADAAREKLAEGGLGSFGAISRAADYVELQYRARLRDQLANVSGCVDPVLRFAFIHREVTNRVLNYSGGRSSSEASNMDDRIAHAVDIDFLRGVEDRYREPTADTLRKTYSDWEAERREADRVKNEAARVERERRTGVKVHPVTGRKVTSQGVKKVLAAASIEYLDVKDSNGNPSNVLAYEGHIGSADIWYRAYAWDDKDRDKDKLQAKAVKAMEPVVDALKAAGYAAHLCSETPTYDFEARAWVSVQGWEPDAK